MAKPGMPAIPPADLARIRVPTMLIWGRHDLATQLSVAQDASVRHGWPLHVRHGWPLHVVENAADDPAMEQAEAFLETLRAALENPGSNPAWTSIRA